MRDDDVVAESAVECAVCHRSRTRGAHSETGDVFICDECQADAAQFIAIQDSTYHRRKPETVTAHDTPSQRSTRA